MVAKTNTFAAFLVLVFLVCGSTAVASVLLKRNSLPGPANLTEVEQRVAPGLAKRLARQGLTLGAPVYIGVFKESAELELWVRKTGGDFGLFKTYSICSFSGTLGPKLKEGDRQAPEGFYSVTPGQMNPKSRYHLSFNIGFPNAYDRSQGRTGSFLMIHGNCVSIDCYAMTNAGIEEIYVLANEAFKNGQGAVSVHLFPFQMTLQNMQRHNGSAWLGFWSRLKEGYDAFEHTGVPPLVGVKDGAYWVAARPAHGERVTVLPISKPVHR